MTDDEGDVGAELAPAEGAGAAMGSGRRSVVTSFRMRTKSAEAPVTAVSIWRRSGAGTRARPSRRRESASSVCVPSATALVKTALD